LQFLTQLSIGFARKSGSGQQSAAAGHWLFGAMEAEEMRDRRIAVLGMTQSMTRKPGMLGLMLIFGSCLLF